jgi:hypothetical protein
MQIASEVMFETSILMNKSFILTLQPKNFGFLGGLGRRARLGQLVCDALTVGLSRTNRGAFTPQMGFSSNGANSKWELSGSLPSSQFYWSPLCFCRKVAVDVVTTFSH